VICLIFVIWDLEFPAFNQHKFNGETLRTVRQKIVDLISNQKLDAREISREVGIREKEVYEHLVHIAKSLATKGKALLIEPSRCLSCGYVFEDRKRFTRPGRCPSCKQSHLQSPSFSII
jgi:predicted Zn-ribbon and HTH transcriptional regulator